MPQVVVPVATWIAGAVSVAGAAVGITGAASAWMTVAVYTVSEIALYAGMSYAVDAVQRPKQKQTGYELTFNLDPAYPREMVCGTRMVGGSMVARYSRGSNRNNAHFVVQVADHPVEALLEAYGDGRLVRADPLTHGVRTEITAYSNSGGPRVWMTWHDGRPGQTADAGLVSASAQDPEVQAGRIPAWTSECVGAGCAYVHVEVQYDSDILTSIPSWTFLVKGGRFYDRRKDSTAGGDGDHRHGDPSTWEYTTNAAVITDHYMLGYKVEDDDLAFGIGLSKTEVPYAQFAALADLADEDLETGTGGAVETIKRYEINGVLTSAAYFQDQLEDFQIQMSARIIDLGGRIGIIGAEERVPVVSLTASDLVQGEPLQFADKLPFSDLYGSVAGQFADPGNNYQPTPYVPQRTSLAALPDGGEAQAVTMDLPLEVHPRRAVRNVAAWLARESLQPRMIGIFGPKAWKLEPGDHFVYTDEGLQVENETFEVIDILKNKDFTVTLTARAINADFLAFDIDNDPDLSVPPDVPPVDVALDSPGGSIEAIALAGSGATEPALRFTLGSIDPLAREIVIEVRAWDGTEPTGDGIIATAHSDQFVTIIRAGILPGQAYVARIKARSGFRESPWSDWSSPVTTGSTYTVPGSSLASAIVGQGALATLNTVAASVLAAGVGKNCVIDGDFRFNTVFWRGQAGSGSAANSQLSASNLRYWQCVGSGVTVGSFVQIDALPQFAAFACSPGDRLEASAYFGRVNTSQVQLGIAWCDASGVAFDATFIATDTTSTASGAGDITSYARAGGFATAPTGTRFAILFVRGTASTSTPTFRIAKPYIGRAGPAQTELTAWNLGFEATPGADPTGSNTAAAIVGQGALATLNAVVAAQLAAGIGKNCIIDGDFRFGTAFWRGVAYSGSASNSVLTASDVRYWQCTGSGVTVGSFIQIDGLAQRVYFPVTAGDWVEASAYIGRVNTSSVSIVLDWRDDSAAQVGTSVLQTTTATSAGAGVLGTYTRIGGMAQAPSGATKVFLYVIATASTSAPVLRVTRPFLAKANAAQTELTPWNIGFNATPGADPTAANTAAAIASQGSQATANHYRGSTYPYTPTEGSWWADTSTNQLKLYTGGAWNTVASIAGSGGYAVSADNMFPTGPIPGGGNPKTQTVTLSIAGGTGPYTVTVDKQEGITGDPNVYTWLFKTAGTYAYYWEATTSGIGMLMERIVTLKIVDANGRTTFCTVQPSINY